MPNPARIAALTKELMDLIDKSLQVLLTADEIEQIKNIIIEGGMDVINTKNEKGITALMVICYGLPETLRAILAVIPKDKLAEVVNTTDDYGATALGYTCLVVDPNIYTKTQSLRCLEILIAAGADVHIKSKGGFGVLLAAASAGKPGHVKALLNEGVDANISDDEQVTALMTAISASGSLEPGQHENRESLECINLLLAAGADPYHKDVEGLDAIWWARRKGYNTYAEAINTQIIRRAYGNNKLVSSFLNGGIDEFNSYLSSAELVPIELLQQAYKAATSYDLLEDIRAPIERYIESHHTKLSRGRNMFNRVAKFVGKSEQQHEGLGEIGPLRAPLLSNKSPSPRKKPHNKA